MEVRVTPMRTEVIIRATRTQDVLGEKGRRIRELTAAVQKRFQFPDGSVELYAEKVAARGLCAVAQAESLRYKLLGGLAVRRACYGVLRYVMEAGAKGCEVIVSGKLRAQRAKAMKFVDGYMLSAGNPVHEYVDCAVRHVLLRQGVLGIKVRIMKEWDPTGTRTRDQGWQGMERAGGDKEKFAQPGSRTLRSLLFSWLAGAGYARLRCCAACRVGGRVGTGRTRGKNTIWPRARTPRWGDSFHAPPLSLSPLVRSPCTFISFHALTQASRARRRPCPTWSRSSRRRSPRTRRRARTGARGRWFEGMERGRGVGGVRCCVAKPNLSLLLPCFSRKVSCVLQPGKKRRMG